MLLGCLAALVIALPTSAQWQTFGNTISGSDWLGATSNSTIPLQIRNDAGQPIDFWTTQSFRARINPRMIYPTLNSFLNIPAHGFTLITPDNGFLDQPPKGPFSRLHLAEGGKEGNAEQWGYRPWQRNGITFTGNGDQGYIGQKYRGDNETDMVIQWSDNPGNWKGDRMRFIFTGGYNSSSSTGRNSLEGEEGMRLFPTVHDGINVGVGDFFAYGGDPTERLHVRDGRVRIQQLPDDPEVPELTKFLVVDDSPSPSGERGVLKWRNLPVVPPASSCDWTLNPTTRNNVSTAFGPLDPDCPDDGDAVGIGVNLGSAAAPAKLVVGTTTMPRGASISATMPTANNHGLVVDAQGGTANNYGIKVTSRGSGGGLWRYGIMADVTQGQSSRTRGVYAETDGATYTAYAGFFQANDSATWTRGISARAMNGGITAAGVEGKSHAMAQRNTGVLGVAADVSTSILLGGRRIGVAGFAHSNSADMVCYGVYGRAGGADDPNGLHGHTKWAGYFQGYTYTPGATWSASDVQLKQNIGELPPDSAAAWLMQLAPKRYDFNWEEYPYMGLPSEHQYGLISQEV